MSSRRQMLEFLSLSRLPSEFQEVEYLESSGTQYIDTGFVPSSDSKCICELSFNNSNAQLNGVYVGSGFRFQFGILSNANYIGLGTKSQYFTLPLDTNKHTFILDAPNKTISIDSETYTDSSITFDSNTYSFPLFRRRNLSTVDTAFACSAKLYSCQIYDNGTLVRNFIPCYRKADNVSGLYDLVNGVFYTNAGTGTFIVGGNV